MKHFYGGIPRLFSGITKEEKNNLYLAAALLIVLFVFLVFVCLPQQVKFAAKIKELRLIEKQISEVMSIAQGKDLTQAVKALNTSLLEMTDKLPATEEAVVYRLSDSAKKLRLNVIHITPQETVLLAGKASGFDIKEMPITITLAGEFRAMGEYIDKLEKNQPVLVKIKKLDVKNKGERQAPLDVNLELSAFMAVERN
jgi:hypothetical protein